MFTTIVFEDLVLHPMRIDVKSLQVIDTDSNMESNSFSTTTQRIMWNKIIQYKISAYFCDLKNVEAN